MTFGKKIIDFYKHINLDVALPAGVEAMNPYQDKTAFALSSRFYNTFYNDTNTRSIILGINPGRFGGGITGIPFTDPIKLEKCGIANDLKKKAELSADYIYTMIDAYGGVEKFYSRFYISALSPLGFVKDGKNLNYYDMPQLVKAVEPFMIDSLRKQLKFGIDTSRCFCLGEGKNFDYLNGLNKKYSFFEEVVPLAHPRFIMQYKRKHIPTYIQDYLKKLSA